ncbi:MAG: SpoIID/LytB domain-containing protein [Candidatus Eisenbacteria bacterium]
MKRGSFLLGAGLLLPAVLLVLAAACSPRPPAGPRPPEDEWTTKTGVRKKPESRRDRSGRPEGRKGARPDGGRPIGPLRVALRVDVPSVEVGLASGALLRWEGGEVAVPGGSLVRFAPAPGGAIEMRGPFDRVAVPSPVNVLPERAESFTLEGKPHAGTLVLVRSEGGLAAINAIGLEDYLRGVVPWEIGWLPEERIEALKAQAVAARTYALTRAAVAAEGAPWDLVATESDQVYRGLERTDPVVDRAIEETAGIVAAYKGGLLRAYYSSTCGGRTATVEEVWFDREPAPYLRSIGDGPGGSDSPSRAFCRASPHFRWTERWKGEDLDAVLRNLAAEQGVDRARLGRLCDVRLEETGRSGRVLSTLFETEEADVRIGGDRVRWVLRRPGGAGILRSGSFRLEVKRSGRLVTEIAAEGRGHGHGVGMCQWGAMGMADEGYRYEEILRHYYPGVRLEPAVRRHLEDVR